MYKKCMLLFGLISPLILCASDVTSWFEVKPSYFFFARSPMHEIYDKGGFQVQGSASIPVCKYIDLYGSVGYRQAWGHALNSEEQTSLMVVPVDLGLKAVVKFDERFDFFAAMGPRYFAFYQHNDSLYVNSIITDAGLGVFINTGFNIELADHFLLGIFGEYSYEHKVIYSSMSNVYSNPNAQIGGFAFGLSLGYRF